MITTPRPVASCPFVVEEAIQSISQQVLEWSGEECEQGILDDLSDVIRSSHDFCGYEIAKKLDNIGWSPDATLVDILDQYETLLARAHDEAVKKWVVENNIVPQKKVGDAVRITTLDKKIVDGFIHGVNAALALYTVNVPSLGHLAYSYENGIAKAEDKFASGVCGLCLPIEKIDD